MNEFAKQARAKGWAMKEVAERWGLTPRRLSQISADPKQVHWDALAGLPDRSGNHESASIWDASGKLPHEEGRYVVIYRQGNIGPKMFIADLYYHAESSEFRWSLGLDNVEILAWLTNVPEYTY